ncbi:MET3, partial [Symbiodinium sp. CCMP2456]
MVSRSIGVRHRLLYCSWKNFHRIYDYPSQASHDILTHPRKDVKDSILLVHPTCGPTQPGDIDGLVRIQTYEALKTETEKEYPMFRWAYLPYSMKMAGPRE